MYRKRMFSAAIPLMFIVLIPGSARPGSHDDDPGEGAERQAEIYHTSEEKKKAGLARKITDRITFSGLLEVEAFYEDLELEEDSEGNSDLLLSSVQVGFEADVVEGLSLTAVIIYEEGEDSGIDLDEATLDFERNGWFGRLGLHDLPSGVFPGHMITSPLTEDLGELQATALTAGYRHELFEVAGFVFNGDVGPEGESGGIDSWGLRALLRPLPSVELGASYLSDLAESGAELVEAPAGEVGAWSAVGIAGYGDVEFHGEILGAVGRFPSADLDTDGDGRGDRPLAWNVEIAWEPADILEIAARVEGSREFPGEPELQYGAGLSWSPWKHVSLSLEYLRGEFDGGFGEGMRRRDRIAAEAAFEF